MFIVFPKRVEDGIALLARYARMFGVEGDPKTKELVRAGLRAVEAQKAVRAALPPLRAFCPIWMDPLMTVHGDTYISDALDLAGAQNVFADRARRYPLAADLRNAVPLSKERVAERDTRYPRVTFDEVVERADPDVVVLPDEPHPFTKDEGDRISRARRPRAKSGRVHVDGKDLCWYGAWAVEAIPSPAPAESPS